MPPINPRNIEVVDPAQAAIFRQKTMPERVAMIAAANRSARELLAGVARTVHPDWTEEQVLQEVVRRMANGSA